VKRGVGLDIFRFAAPALVSIVLAYTSEADPHDPSEEGGGQRICGKVAQSILSAVSRYADLATPGRPPTDIGGSTGPEATGV